MNIGDKVIRYMGGQPLIKLVITDITHDTIICGDWTFDKETGAEIDEFLGWGPPPLMTGSYIKEIDK